MTARPVLLATDLSEGARRAAVALRHVADPDAPVHVVHVLMERPNAASTEAARREAAAWAEGAGVGAAPLRVLHGDPGRVLAQEAASLGASLVAVGSHGAGMFERALLGSVARDALRRVRGADVLVARASGAWPPRRVLVATDFGETSERAARRGLALARRHGAEILLAHVVDPAGLSVARGDADRMLAEQNARDLGGAARLLALRGRPHVELSEAARAEGADLVVVGSHGAGALERALLGSVAEGVVERSPVSVLVVEAGAAQR